MAAELDPERAPHDVLLVEDEALIRTAVAEALRDAGLTVIEAADSDEAWSYLVTGAPVDLVLTDIRMPGSMDGVELADRIAEQFTETVVIVTSGGGKYSREFSYLSIPKPYRLSYLTKFILDTLNKTELL